MEPEVRLAVQKVNILIIYIHLKWVKVKILLFRLERRGGGGVADFYTSKHFCVLETSTAYECQPIFGLIPFCCHTPNYPSPD